MATRITTLAILDEAAKKKEREISLAKDRKIEELNEIVANLKKQLAAKERREREREQEQSETSEKGNGYDLIDEILDEVEQNEQRISESLDRNDLISRPRINISSHGHQTDDEDADDFEENVRRKQSQLWMNINNKLQNNDIKRIKYLIKTKQLRINERDEKGNNLLMLCCKYGLYDMVSLCINLGSSMTNRNNSKKTALDIARNNGHPEIEELLIMHSLKTELTHQVMISSKSLCKKQGITTNFIKILKDIFANQSLSIGQTDYDYNESKSEDSSVSLSKRQAISNTFLTTVAQALSGLNIIIIRFLLSLFVCIFTLYLKVNYWKRF